MKIIKEIKLADKETVKTCYKCRTKFYYTEKDTEIDRDGTYVKYPSCKAFIAIK